MSIVFFFRCFDIPTEDEEDGDDPAVDPSLASEVEVAVVSVLNVIVSSVCSCFGSFPAGVSIPMGVMMDITQ